MNDIELLAELLGDIARDLRPEIIEFPDEALYRLPAPQSNSIGVTLWHIARGIDFLGARMLLGGAAEDELWHRQGWRERTGYDPRGIGYGGWGVVTGYTWDEVLAIPRLSAAELMQYLDDACDVAAAGLLTFTSETVRQPATAVMDGRLTFYQWVKTFYKGFQAHVGEIIAIMALLKKQST